MEKSKVIHTLVGSWVFALEETKYGSDDRHLLKVMVHLDYVNEESQSSRSNLVHI